MEYPTFDPEDLKRQQEEAESKKALYGAMGAVAGGFDNVPSSYQLLYNKSDKGAGNSKSIFDNLQKGVEDPSVKQAKLYESFKNAKDVEDQRRNDELLEQKRDPESRQSKALKMLAPRWGIQVSPEMSAYDIEQMIDPKRMMETEAASNVDFNKQKALKQMEERFKSAESEKNRKNDFEKAFLKQQLAESEKNLPQNVTSAATYGKRVEDANKQIEGLINKGFDPTSIGTSLQSMMLPERFQPEEIKLMQQAQRNFINAVLRRESGSAISDTEFESGNKQYFPQPGDTQAVLDQKKRNREVALAGLKAEGAKAWNRLEGQLPPESQSVSNGKSSDVNTAGASDRTPVKKEYNAKLNKTRLTMSDGSVQMVDGRR